MIENIKEAFDVYTGKDCSVCIKILDANFHVKTYFRDSVSLRSRDEASKKLVDGYNYKSNTAFFKIMDTEDSYFVNNDLRALKELRQYDNANMSWEEHYNATLVVPIRMIGKKINKMEEDSYVVGFICVDSMKGKFDGAACVDILAAYADHCYNLLVLFNTFNKALSTSKTYTQGVS